MYLNIKYLIVVKNGRDLKGVLSQSTLVCQASTQFSLLIKIGHLLTFYNGGQKLLVQLRKTVLFR